MEGDTTVGQIPSTPHSEKVYHSSIDPLGATTPVDLVMAPEKTPNGAGQKSVQRLLSLRALTPALGAEVLDVDLSQDIDDALFAQIYQAFLRQGYGMRRQR